MAEQVGNLVTQFKGSNFFGFVVPSGNSEECTGRKIDDRHGERVGEPAIDCALHVPPEALSQRQGSAPMTAG